VEAFCITCTPEISAEDDDTRLVVLAEATELPSLPAKKTTATNAKIFSILLLITRRIKNKYGVDTIPNLTPPGYAPSIFLRRCSRATAMLPEPNEVCTTKACGISNKSSWYNV
jgi:hypothetical protein